MKKNLSSFICAICVFYACTGYEITPNYTELYNLDFKLQTITYPVYKWIDNAAYSQVNLAFAADSLHISRIYLQNPLSDRLITELEQRVLLPDNQAKIGNITIESKGKNIEIFSLIINCINKEEDIVFSDTIRYVPDSVFTHATKNISLTNTELLNFKIHIEGKKNEVAYVVLSKLSIIIDGQGIDKFPPRTLSLLHQPKYVEIDTTNFQELNNRQKEIEAPQIISLGESVHNNEDIHRFVCQYAINQIENNHCKLIVIEKPMEQTLAYNRYIRDTDFELNKDEIANKSMLYLMDKLRQYNIDRPEKDKIAILGMDYNASSVEETAINIFDYLSLLNQRLKLREMDELSILLVEKSWDDVIEFLQKHQKALETVFLPGELENITHILRISGTAGKNIPKRSEKRDSIQFENAKFLINSLSDDSSKILIYAHSVHTNAISTFPAVPCLPFGSYMKKEYGEEYCPLSILIGQGQAGAFDTNLNYAYSDLATPISGSVEHFLNLQNKDFLYIPVNKELNHLVYSRFKGNYHIGQEFFPMNFYQRCKGLFFIRGKNTISPNAVSIEEKLENNVLMLQKREKTISVIKDRLKKNE
jgi:erythromycin esterase-like protein